MNIDTVASPSTLYPHVDALYAASAPVLARPWESLRAYRYQPAPRSPIVVRDETDPAVKHATYLRALRELGGDALLSELCERVGVAFQSSFYRKALLELARAGHIKQYRKRIAGDLKPGRVKLI